MEDLDFTPAYSTELSNPIARLLTWGREGTNVAGGGYSMLLGYRNSDSDAAAVSELQIA